MALQSAVRPPAAGIPGAAVVAFVPAGAGGDTFAIGNSRLLVVNRAGSGTVTLTFTTPNTDQYGGAVADPSSTVAVGAAKVFGPFGSDLADANGNVKMVSDVTAGVDCYLIA